MRVAIVGGPGIGKSTLVRQLADLYHNGAYGEGEEGVWDPRVLEDIDAADVDLPLGLPLISGEGQVIDLHQHQAEAGGRRADRAFARLDRPARPFDADRRVQHHPEGPLSPLQSL